MEESTLHHWTEKAWEWLSYQYEGVDFDAIANYDLSWDFHRKKSSRGFNEAKCRVHWKTYQKEIDSVNIYLIKDDLIWSTYRRKSVGIYAPPMRVDHKFAIQSQAVHEFTHFIQAMQYRDFSEAETTFNEIKFAFKHNFSYFKKCEVLIDKRYNQNDNIDCII